MDEHREQDQTRLLTADEAAKKLCISIRTLRHLIATGMIPVVRVSAKRIVVDERDLMRYIESRRESNSPRETE